MSPFTPALRLHGRYVLAERIGLGGMSEVWRADDEVLHRPVAVKALVAQFAVDPQLRATIGREARTAARLTHPHITQVYDYGEATLAGGVVVPYLVMELVEGVNLADRLATGPLPWPQAARLAGQVAAALAVAHRVGVVHRDIKPGNVMLTETGAKVLDFGIAALAGPHPLASASGELFMGTPAYTAPERLTPGPADPASDVYALGALLYRTLTGRTPLPVRSFTDAIEAHARRTPVPPPAVPGLPTELAALVMACLAEEPARRPSAARVAARLGAAGPTDAPTAVVPATAASQPPTLVERVARPSARPAPAGVPGRPRSGLRLVGVLAAVALLVLAGFVGAFGLGGERDRSVAGTPSTAPSAPAPASRPSTPAGPATSAPAPSRSAPSADAFGIPRTAAGVAAEFVAVLLRAQLSGDIDRRTADELRDRAGRLIGSRPKDVEKRVEDLTERIDRAAERQQIGAATAERLRDLADAYGDLRDDEDDD
ncbi:MULTISPECIES: serine/threonine-protein kinase [Micromonospora]|uniref:non-specific serine/threonine protein kinase n=1 Tax=Micromonospora yangpuensis TaxID=683228 RepID=A0A1C6UUT5_9ACTN|nr:serine/threonine-protein kinase [Micromonospora yangpuensis]SCL57726.1 serine/threonine protein kinase [Micromonospora yangpuensis]